MTKLRKLVAWLKVYWLLVSLPVVMMVTFSSWQRALFVYVVLVGGLWLLNELLRGPVIWLMCSDMRRPGETLGELSARIVRERASRKAAREQDRQRYGRRSQGYHRYRTVILDCGHDFVDFFPENVPCEGDKFWCWKHGWNGPAQNSTVLRVNIWPPT